MSTLIEQTVADNNTNTAKIRDYVYTQIRNGTIKGGQKLNMKEIANKWGVSAGTVNQSLQMLATAGILKRKRRTGTFVSENVDITSAFNATSHVINALVPLVDKTEYACMAKGLLNASAKEGLTAIISGAENSIAQYVRIIQHQIEQKKALALVPPIEGIIPVETLINLYNSRLPVVTCYRSLNGFGWPLVGIDTAYNTRIAVEHLSSLGCENIGLIGSDPSGSYQGLLKEHTFFETLEQYGLTIKRNCCLWLDPPSLHGKMWMFSVIDTIAEWMLSNPKMDAICGLHDLAAWAAISAASKIGKKVPDDIAITGNGNFLLFGFEHNDLTTIDMCYDDFGSAIIDLIQRMRQDETIEPNTEVLIKGKLIKGHSTNK